MKKVILILSIMISCLGCTHEGPHSGCDDESLNLIFTHDGNTANFDQFVANDIELYLYDSEGKIIEKRHIPYESIKGGQPYPFEIQYAGKTNLLAWTLSKDEDTNKTSPVFMNEENFSTASFTMNERHKRQSRIFSGSAQELFLGSLTFNQNPLEGKIINVDVKKQLCSITVTIEEGNNFKTQYPGNISMNISGSSYSYKVAEDKQSGDRIIVEDSFSYLEDKNEYISRNKVIPASMDSETGLEDNIVITIFEDNIARLMVDTEVKAQRGKQIDIVIRPTKLEVIITVDSWQIRKALVVL